MKRYLVIFEKHAQENVRESYDWGCRVWGKREAQRWVRELRTAILRQLSIVIACYSPSEKAEFTSFMFEEPTSEHGAVMLRAAD